MTAGVPARRRRGAGRPLTRGCAVLAVAALTVAACGGGGTALQYAGPEEGALLNAEAVEAVAFEARPEEADPEALEGLVVLLDGEDVTAAADVGASALVYAPGTLPDGERVVAVGRAGDDEDTEVEVLHEWTFEVDATPPEVELTAPEGAVVAGEELTVAGVTEPAATVEVAGSSATAGDDGAFELVVDRAPEGGLTLTATDEAGNETVHETSLVAVPSRAEADVIRTVHVSFCAWATPSLRDPVLELVEEGRITAVQLDLKDETGKIGHETDVELAARIGANEPDCRVDLPAAIEHLHGLGVPVIGRIVAFADPVLAGWAWEHDERDWVIQTAAGEKFVGKYAGFSNFAHPDVIEYNVAVAEEAAAAGVDHILWDYVRKPDGPPEQFDFVGLDVPPEDAITDFVRTADERLAPYRIEHGASLYGVSADRTGEVSQDVPALAEHLDYVAPMIYPSHWGPGEYGVDDPLHQPHDMVVATLEQWLGATEGKRARVVPWLEDSNWPVRLGYPDRARYVREQIQGTYDSGIDEWMLWDSAVRYTVEGIID